jgi:hypothetical protein
MSFEVVELLRWQTPTTTRTAVIDYFRNPAVCRERLWVGLEREYVERVVLEVENIWPWPDAMGWILGGTLLQNGWTTGGTIVGWGWTNGAHPVETGPVPGHPSVTYTATQGSNRIEFASTPGQAEECFFAQVRYRFQNTADRGGVRQVCISGSNIDLPKLSVDAEQECLKRVHDLFDRHKFIPPDRPWPPWPPIERALSRLRGDDAVRMRAYIETLDRVDPESEKELFDAISSELRGFVEAASFADESALDESGHSPRVKQGG